ncbi:hypothetical protein LUX57_03595 [Actinomadura madurae]|nr:hypothetical protein [Actinomadura madurae]MCP9964364.1 hypothetical protein [Actinomadura madurae]MCP9976848.1 hypothetical protein [Actinomadura madurae]
MFSAPRSSATSALAGDRTVMRRARSPSAIADAVCTMSPSGRSLRRDSACDTAARTSSSTPPAHAFSRSRRRTVRSTGSSDSASST